MNRFLKIVGGPLRGSEIALVAGTTVKVGSGEGCDILVSDPTLGDVAFELEVTDEDVTITLPDGTECSVADLVDGTEEFEGITAEVDGDGFVKTITYQVYLTPEEVFTARDEFDGLTDFVYSFKAGAWATGDNGQGFKPTEFSLVIPLGKTVQGVSQIGRAHV